MRPAKRVSRAHQLHRTLGVTYKTAWFMAYRIRAAMRPTDQAPFGNGGGFVESDETYIGRDPNETKAAKARGPHHKNKVLSLIDRTTGKARSMVVVDELSTRTVMPILRANISHEAKIMTDEATHYT